MKDLNLIKSTAYWEVWYSPGQNSYLVVYLNDDGEVVDSIVFEG